MVLAPIGHVVPVFNRSSDHRILEGGEEMKLEQCHVGKAYDRLVERMEGEGK